MTDGLHGEMGGDLATAELPSWGFTARAWAFVIVWGLLAFALGYCAAS